jgi:cytochrome c-type biogenesis protein CcmH
LWLQIRHRSRNGADVPMSPLTPDEEAKLQRLLAADAPEKQA